MKSMISKCLYYLLVIAISEFELTRSDVISDQTTDKVTIMNGVPDDGGGPENRILTRKRRFLSFPEGSSFQVVYDQTIPIIGSTLLFTVGITCAMAWQLPSISFLEIIKMLQEDALKGSLIRRTDENVNQTVLIDTSTSKYDTGNKHSYYYTDPKVQNHLTGLSSQSQNILNYYYKLLQLQQQQQQQQRNPSWPGNSNRINYYTTSGNNFAEYDKYRPKWPQKQPLDRPNGLGAWQQNFLTPYNWTRNDWTSVVNRAIQAWVQRHPPNYQFSRKRFYPVFGKRSIDENTHPEDKLFLDHHRATRHELYAKIEKFLEAKGKHGNHCVRRALCETGQRKNDPDAKPESFLREILKAVFSLPTTHETPDHPVHRQYDEAHAHPGDCSEKYPHCQDSFWAEDFIF
ncbi:uncharacterized protein LOC129756937 [Uranotaenia lowii]|uniref:uncharacterized protein LOC129756937 n=1 Tax=Uranotaenia lowii TaxID=190385 RepID=UPI00247881F7|nr:uncharacterized protein LOC129756937 [Uranotaenia lowii]